MPNDKPVPTPETTATPTTFFAMAQARAETASDGRVSGAVPLPPGQVPRQPAGSPWSCDPVGIELPLGIAVDAPIVCGTFAEVEASKARLRAVSAA